jgi:hypothetical protein
MCHSDDEGLVLPPRLAPIQVVIVPITGKKEEEKVLVLEKAREYFSALKAKGILVKLDDRDGISPGYKFADYELKGVPLRIAIGARDVAAGNVELARRDTKTKEIINAKNLPETISNLLNEIQENIYNKAKDYRDTHIHVVNTWDKFKDALDNKTGFVSAHWDGTSETEEKIKEFIPVVKNTISEVIKLVEENTIFIKRTANVGVLPLDIAINYGCTGPVLRGSGLRYDLRKVDAYSIYPELDFDIPIGVGEKGQTGDCWDRNHVRLQECLESIKMMEQCLVQLTSDHKRDRSFNPQEFVPKKIRPAAMDVYVRAENPKGELGFFIRSDGKSDIPTRMKVRACSFHHLSVIPALAKGAYLADLIAIIGSMDLVMGEVDR